MDRSKVILYCGALGIFGCVVVIVANIAGIMVVERHDPISETISRLAVGRYGWIQDTGLILFALGLLACGVGLGCWRVNGLWWKIGAGLLVVLAIDVVLIAAHNEYGDRDSEKYVIHFYCVIALGVLFAAIPLLLAPGLREIGRAWARASIAAAALWIIFAPIFFVVPTSWDGAYERALGLLVIGWTAMIAWLLIRRGRAPAAVPRGYAA